jgi:hypothetical protein
MRRDLAGPVMPSAAEYLYWWFCGIASGRSSAGFGPNPLSAVEILAWSRLSGNHVAPWEFEVLRRLDHKWLEIYSELHKPDPAPKKGQGR